MTKYRAIRTNGYASKREAKRAHELELLQSGGILSGLRKQVKYVLLPKDDLGREIYYIADFVYYDQEGQQIVEDSKGFRTPVYKLKRRLMWATHRIKIFEV